jgi:hypothetical protein
MENFNEAFKTSEEIDLYEIVKLEEVLLASGWQVVRVGLLERYLCHAATGRIIFIYNDEPTDDVLDLTHLVSIIQKQSLKK